MPFFMRIKSTNPGLELFVRNLRMLMSPASNDPTSKLYWTNLGSTWPTHSPENTSGRVNPSLRVVLHAAAMLQLCYTVFQTIATNGLKRNVKHVKPCGGMEYQPQTGFTNDVQMLFYGGMGWVW
jgi:hypothetical protein